MKRTDAQPTVFDSISLKVLNLNLNLFCWAQQMSNGSTAITRWKHHGSRKITAVKPLGPRLAFGWVTIQGLDVDAVATNTVKSQKQRTGPPVNASGAKK